MKLPLSIIFPYGREEWYSNATFWIRHKLMGTICHNLQTHYNSIAVPAEITRSLQLEFWANTVQNQRFYKEYARILHICRSYGITLQHVKGLHLAYSVYEHIGERPMRDVDLLCKSADRQIVDFMFREAGYQNTDTLNDGLYSMALTEFPWLTEYKFDLMDYESLPARDETDRFQNEMYLLIDSLYQDAIERRVPPSVNDCTLIKLLDLYLYAVKYRKEQCSFFTQNFKSFCHQQIIYADLCLQAFFEQGLEDIINYA